MSTLKTLARWACFAILLLAGTPSTALASQSFPTPESGALGAILTALALFGLFGLGAVTKRGATTDTDTPADIVFKDVSNVLTYRRPQDSPLYVALRNLRKGPRARGTKIHWHEQDIIPRNTTTTGSTSSGSSGATKQIPVADDIYQEDDVLQLPDNTNDPDAILQVQSTSSGNITVVKVDGGNETSWGTVPAMANGEKIVRLGNAKKEFYDSSPYRSTYPVEEFNFVQRMDEVVGISRTKQATADYAGDSWESQRDNQVYDFQTSRESTLFFGTREKKVISGETKHYMGGIDYYNLPNSFNYTATSFDVPKILDITRQTFVGNRGSDVRYLHADSLFIQDIMELDSDKLRRSNYRSNLLRREIPQIEMGFGTLRIVHENLFDEMGRSRFGFILDYENLQIRELNPMKVVRLNLEETQGKDGQAVQVKEESSLEVRYLDTHAKIEGSAS